MKAARQSVGVFTRPVLHSNYVYDSSKLQFVKGPVLDLHRKGGAIAPGDSVKVNAFAVKNRQLRLEIASLQKTIQRLEFYANELAKEFHHAQLLFESGKFSEGIEKMGKFFGIDFKASWLPNPSQYQDA